MADRWVNRDAVEWVFYESDVAAEQFPVLTVVASFTNAEGRGAYPARSLVAKLTRRSVRKVVYDLAELLKRGQLTEGDQHLVMYIRADRRPHVYDLPDGYRLWLPRGATPARRNPPRGARNDIHGVQGTTERGAEPAPEEFLKNSGKGGRPASQAPPPATEHVAHCPYPDANPATCSICRSERLGGAA